MSDESVIRRLVLAKTFLIGAKDSLKRTYDENALAVAVVMLHDAVDNMLGAVASHKSVSLKPKSFLQDTYSSIVSQEIQLASNTEIAQLNTLRNNIKHQGLMPNQKDVMALLPQITKFCEDTCSSIFGTPLSLISLKEQIEDRAAKADVEAIEQAVANKEYKKAMFDAATTLFVHFTDKRLATWRLQAALAPAVSRGKKASAYDIAFPNGIARDLNLDLIEIGIEPYLYYRFRNLTPDVGYIDYKTKRLIYKRDGSTWHDGNWTEENALFCLNFVINALVSQQKRYNGYTIQTRDHSHKVKFIRDSVALDFMYKPTLSFQKDSELSGKLLSFADGAIQPSKHSEKGYTDIMIQKSDGTHDIILIKPGDVKILEETHQTTREWF